MNDRSAAAVKKIWITRILESVLGLGLFSLALWVLHRELAAYHIRDIVTDMRSLPTAGLLGALALTILSYAVMTGYDTLALEYIKQPLAYSKIALASFVGYAFSNNIGFSMVAGSTVRFRLYSAWGLSFLEISRIVAFCTLTLWLGFFSLAGALFLIEPLTVPRTLHLPFVTVRPLGIFFLVLVCTYIALSARGSHVLKIRNWKFELPSLKLIVPQMLIAVFDWTLAGSVLYILLRSSSNAAFIPFLGIFLLAQLTGLASQVPGGLGVFESVIILLLSPHVPTRELLGPLLAYRTIYYLLPLVAATALMGAHEAWRRKKELGKAVRVFGSLSSVAVPPALAISTFVAGAILLFSGALPAVKGRLEWIQDILPLPVIEMSHFLGSLAGVGLLLLARSLIRRIDAAYFLAIGFLSAGIVFSLLKGLDYEEAIILSVILAAFIPCRPYFYRKASLFSQKFSAEWIVTIILVSACAVWIMFFSYKHVEYTNSLWWRFVLQENAPRSLRATTGAIFALLLFGLVRLLHPSAPGRDADPKRDMETAESIVRRSPCAYAYLALLGDKRFLFSETGNTFIMFALQGRSWIAMGDPVGPVDEHPELVWRFREMSNQFGGWPVFYEVGPDNLSLYVEMGLSMIKIGEEARVPLTAFSMSGKSRQGLRHTNNKLEREGCSFELVMPDKVSGIIPDLKRISDSWLTEKKTREKGFSLGFFDETYVCRTPVAIVRQHGRMVAFANLWPSAEKAEISVDLMRFAEQEAPGGVMDFLFTRLLLWSKDNGFHWFNLGMAPLSGLDDHALAPLWNRLGALVFKYGEYFYNFQGLREYKNKFDPVWMPRYLVLPGGLALPQVLANITALTSGGLKGIIAK